MAMKDKVEKIFVKLLDGEDNDAICKDLKKKVMKQLAPEIMESVNKTLVLNLTKWKEDFVKPLIENTIKEEMEKKKNESD